MAAPSHALAPSATLTERVAQWFSTHKREATFLVVGITALTLGTLTYSLYSPPATRSEPSAPAEPKKRKKKSKSKPKKAASAHSDEDAPPAPAALALPDLVSRSPEQIAALSLADRKEAAEKLKAQGNKAYSDKNFTDAISYYSKALEHHQAAVYFSNRAACYTNLKKYEEVIRDTTEALKIDKCYVKALNRRAAAYESIATIESLNESLCDYTAAAIFDQFKTQSTSDSIERVVKALSQKEAHDTMTNREPRLPSPVFLKAYLDVFSKQPLPEMPAEQSTGDEVLLLAMDALDAHNYTHAFTLFQEALEHGLSSEALEARALNMTGTFKFVMGQTQAATEDLDKALMLDPTFIQTYIKRASVAMELGDQNHAFSLFDLAQNTAPNNQDVFYHKGQVHFILGNFDLAISEYNRAIEVSPDFAFSYIQRAVSFYKLGDKQKARQEFEKLTDKFGDRNSDIYNYYGEILLDSEAFDQAIDAFDNAIRIEQAIGNPINPHAWVNKALCLFQYKQEFDPAVALCREALRHDPECDIAVATLAQLELQRSNIKEARELFRRVSQLARSEPDLVQALTYLHASEAQSEFTKRYPEEAVKLNLPILH